MIAELIPFFVLVLGLACVYGVTQRAKVLTRPEPYDFSEPFYQPADRQTTKEQKQMIRIEISSTRYEEKQMPGKNGVWTKREQSAWAYLRDVDNKEDRHPVRILVPLEQNQPPYQPGMYTLAPSSFGVGRWGDLSVRPQLVPLQGKAQA